MERRGTSAAVLAATTIIILIMSLTRVTGDESLCRYGRIGDDGGTHASYVANVLAELAAAVPARSDHQGGTMYPGNGVSGSVFGLASCTASTGRRLCSICLSTLQQLLYNSCQNFAGGVAAVDNVCAMGFKTADD